MIALALAAALLAQDVAEQEPNNDGEKSKQEIAPGATFTGSLDPEGDQDWVHVVCDKDTVCSLAVEIPEGDSARLEIHLARAVLSTRAGDGTLMALRVRFPKGRTSLRLVGKAKGYSCKITAEERGERQEIEPNNETEEAIEILEGQTWRGHNSGFAHDLDCYKFKAEKAGPREIVLKCLPRKEGPFNGYIGLFGADPLKVDYYYINTYANEFHFYPVIDAGDWNVQLTIGGDTSAGAAYEISVLPMGGKVTADEVKAAQAAIDRATRHLMKVDTDQPLQPVATAAESMVLAALSEGRGAKDRREDLDRDIVSRFETRFLKVEGSPVLYVENNIYTHAMATLGLAEAAANGSEKAKALAIKAAEFLIATQNTERKPAAFKGPFDRKARGYGGWRYSPEEGRGDLSIVGWCVIALTAVDAAGIKLDGLRDAIEAGLVYTGTVGDEKGFGYEQPQGGSNVHNSIGALLCLLYGVESPALGFATRELDRRLWSATQVDHGEGYMFYYLYYATRAQYLRSGDAWETWRATALRQLLRRQQEDGSWAAFGYESAPGPRWTTAIGLMMLRLCLNEPPKYLRVEAKGF